MSIEYFTYAIKRTERNYIYVGLTDNVERRVEEHNNGKNKTTKAYRPFELIYSMKFPSRIEAREHEKKLKSGYWKEFLKTLEK